MFTKLAKLTVPRNLQYSPGVRIVALFGGLYLGAPTTHKKTKDSFRTALGWRFDR